MRKRKSVRRKQAPITNIQNNFEIDYEKLALAIVKANSDVDKRSTSKIRNFLMNMFNGTMLIIICLTCVGIMIWIWSDGRLFFAMPIRIFLSIILAFFALTVFLAQQESLNDKNRQIQENFNIIVSFMSLIIALFALIIAIKK